MQLIRYVDGTEVPDDCPMYNLLGVTLVRGRWRRWRERTGHVPAVMRAGIIVLILGVGRHQAGRDRVEHRAALQVPDHLRRPALQLQSTRVSGPRLVRVLGLGSYGGQAFLVRGVGVIVLGDLQPQDALGAADQLHHIVVRHLADVVAVDGDQVVAGAQAGALRRAALHDAAEDARLLARYCEAEALRAADHLDRPHPVVHSLLLPSVLMHVSACRSAGARKRHEGSPGRRALPRSTSRWLADSILQRPRASTSAGILLPDAPPRPPSVTARMNSLLEVWNEFSLFSTREEDPPQPTVTPPLLRSLRIPGSKGHVLSRDPLGGAPGSRCGRQTEAVTRARPLLALGVPLVRPFLPAGIIRGSTRRSRVSVKVSGTNRTPRDARRLRSSTEPR